MTININEWCANRLFYGYTHGHLTGDSPELEFISPINDSDDTILYNICTEYEIENNYEDLVDKW